MDYYQVACDKYYLGVIHASSGLIDLMKKSRHPQWVDDAIIKLHYDLIEILVGSGFYIENK